ncbi:uncharacterized protein [Dysidea avara]|uniref:uncharacterized protein n=1 Tax=Dysidea avara TaxID=196820 RepID=UPI00331B75A4
MGRALILLYYNPTVNTTTTDNNLNTIILRYQQLTLEAVEEAIDARTPIKNNLSIAERTTLNQLKKRTDIIIKKADKGDTIVVETMERYIEDGMKHLSNTNIYKQIPEDINPEITKAINKYLKEAVDKGILEHDTYNFIKPPENPRSPIIYFLKKLHKTPISVRPIVSSTQSPTSNLSHFMDILLKPIVKTIPHILTNSTQLLQELTPMKVPDNTILTSLDVSSLYTNIPTEEAIEIILKYLEEAETPQQPPLQLLREILNFILKYNCFTFCNLSFLQIQGVAMGTKMAPNFANLFMTNFEEKYILQQTTKPFLYRRYIDDIFLIWTDTSEKLKSLIDNINNNHPTIKVTSETSTGSINYLDLTITVKSNKLHTTTFFKPTNTFSYLPGDSHHSNATKQGIFKGEVIRMLRNNSEQPTYIEQTELLRSKFTERKYSKVITQQELPSFEQRAEYLTTTKKATEQKTTFVTSYDPSIPTATIIKEHWPQLLLEDTFRRTLTNGPRTC